MAEDKQDRYIVKGLKNRDDEAYRHLFEQHYGALCCYAEMIVKDSYTAETIVSDLFCHLWEMGRKLDIKGGLRSYLLSSVRNRCLNYLEQNFVSRRDSLPELSPEVSENWVSSSDAAGKILQRELDREIKAAIAALPEKTKAVFSKSRYEGKTYAQISQELGISVNTVKYHMGVALADISLALKDYML